MIYVAAGVCCMVALWVGYVWGIQAEQDRVQYWRKKAHEWKRLALASRGRRWSR